MAATGPVLMQVAGDVFVLPARIAGVIWEGATTSGDTVLLSDPTTGKILWPGRTNTTQTYLGVSFSQEGLSAPNGFKLVQISSGRLFVYLREN